MNQKIYIIGLNHRTAPLDIREKFAFPRDTLRDAYMFPREGIIGEYLLLSTCNRVEIILVSPGNSDPREEVISTWAEHCGQSPEELRQHAYIFEHMEAVTHLFKVASSMDSMVVGEPQILGQLKDSYKNGVETGTTGTIINKLMHKAFSVAKRIRTETKIAQSAVSISYAAVELAKDIFDRLERQKAMLLGTGEMAELAASHLLDAGVHSLTVTNRTYSNAVELAKRFHAHPAPFSELFSHLAETDILITSTGAEESIIQARDLKQIMKKRKHRPMFLIDIAVPRDVDPDANNLDNVYLYDIDDLKGVVEDNLSKRQEEAELAREIILEEVEKFRQWLKALNLTPTIVDLLQQGEQTAEKEVQKSLKKLGSAATPEVQEAMETLAHSLSKKLYHNPINFLKRRAKEEDSARHFISLARRMFDLDREEVPEDAHEFKKKDK
ncbi:MAG: glutamyl-tRNA reductase [Thermodesulfobacteriota bacterium]